MKSLKKVMVSILSIAIFFTMFSTMSFAAYTADNVPAYFFDPIYYATKYSDLQKAFGFDKNALYSHWCNYGKKEGRSPSPVFDPIYYRDNNPDLKKAFGSDYSKLYEHFCSYGINEFRPSSEFYHGAVYKSYYSDLQKAFGNNSKSYMEHFVNFGMKEGRKASASANAMGYKNYMNINPNIKPNNNDNNNNNTNNNTRTGWVKTSGANLYLRQSASTASSIIASMPNNAQVTVYGNATNNFYKVSYNGTTGYASASYITFNNIPNPSGTLYYPLKNAAIQTSSTARTNNVYCDYKAAEGTALYAPTDGTVVFRQAYAKNYNKLASYGNYIEFTSSDGKYTIKCAHLSKFNGVSLKYTTSLPYPCGTSKYSCSSVTLATKTVKKGDLIGYTGKTGNASGPHLHLEVKQNGNAVDPAKVFTTWK